MILIEILDPTEEEVEEDLVAEETQEEGDGRCIEPRVPSAVKTAKSHFVQAVIGRSIAVTVLIKGGTEMITLGDQKGDHIHKIAEEKHEAETANN